MVKTSNNLNHEHWLSMRKKTTIFFVIENFLLGIDFSFVFLTLWSYLKIMLKLDYPIQYYSVILLAAHFPSLFFSWMISRTIDKSRNVRLLIIIINSIVIIGNLLYALPFSPWLLVTGRFLTGFGSAVRPVMFGEIVRSYTPKELSKAIAFFGSAHVIGYVMGPCVNFIVKGIHFQIGLLKVTYLNFPGVLMAISFSSLQIMSIFMLSNLSMIHDLKSERTRKELIDKVENLHTHDDLTPLSSHENKQNYNATKTTKKLLKNIDTCLLLFISFFQNYFECCFFSWLPLLVIDKLQWSVTTLGWISMVVAINTALPCLFLLVNSISNKSLYWVGVSAQFSLIVAQISLIPLRYYNRVNTVNVLCVVLYCLTYLSLGVGEEVFSTSLYAQMICSEYQMFAEGVRLAMYRFGAVMGFLVTAVGFKHMFLLSCVHLVLVIICIIVLILRRSNLSNPTIVVW